MRDLVSIGFRMEATRTVVIELLASCDVPTGAAPWMSTKDRWTVEVPRWSRGLLVWWSGLGDRPSERQMRLAVKHFAVCAECVVALEALQRVSAAAADEWVQNGVERGFHA